MHGQVMISGAEPALLVKLRDGLHYSMTGDKGKPSKPLQPKVSVLTSLQ